MAPLNLQIIDQNYDMIGELLIHGQGWRPGYLAKDIYE